jgi:hypothetical protein
MHDPMRDATQRNYCAREERRCLRQSAEARGNPAAVTLREILGLDDGAAGRQVRIASRSLG